MDNLQKINNDLQCLLVSKTLNFCREIILGYTNSHDAQYELNSSVENIDKLLENFSDYKTPQIQVFQSLGYKIKESLERKIHLEQEKKGIEVIINQNNGITDIILPIKKEDITSNYLANRLYEHVKLSCEGYEFEDKAWEGYKVFSIIEKGEKIDKIELSRKICSSVPEELGGGKITSKHKVYLRVANNFSFKYDLGSIIDNEEIILEERIVNSKRVEKSKNEGDQRIISKEDAIVLFRSGISNQNILEMFPGTPKMTIAGWKSAYSKGMYN